MNRKRIALLGVALLALLAVPARALDSSEESAVSSLINKPTVLILQLKLTPAQVDTLRGLIATFRTTASPLRGSNGAIDQQLKTALSALNPDTCAIGKLVLQEYNNNQAISAAFDKFDRAFSAILTPAQLLRYQQLKKLLLGRLATEPAAALTDATEN